jgi:mono/diheme cytochrome c family protein
MNDPATARPRLGSGLFRWSFLLGLLLGVSGSNLRAAEAVPAFNRDIRPILAENCFACHGPDKPARKAHLRLDVREDAIKSGAITPGKPDRSALVERIFADDPHQVMPPPKTLKKLTPAQKDLLKRWIAAGAEYQPHWSLIAPKRPALPVVKKTSWVRNSIDHFILAELEKRGLEPAPEADRRALARRLSLDLIGLPPMPREVEAFVNDTSPDAYERYVDRLMRSVHWGEHRGRYWLDAARYADTHGIHFDNYREMWAYRDQVINAFNRNQRFDQFTIEQLAGDLLPKPTLEQIVASGFNRCNITTNEGGAIDAEYLVLYTRDRTETVAQVWLGLTAGCAVCHSHKFDPLSQKEFYQMAAFFNNTTQRAMDGNIKDTPPVLPIPRLEDRPRWKSILDELADKRKQVEARKQAARDGFEKWLAAAKREEIAGRLPTEGLQLHAPLSEGTGNATTITIAGKPRSVAVGSGITWGDGHVAGKAYKMRPGGTVELPDAGDLEKSQAFSYGAWVNLPTSRMTGAIIARMDDKSAYRGWDLWVQNGQFGTHIVNTWPTNALKVVGGPRVKPNQWNHVFITYDGSGKVSGVKIYVNGALQTTRRVEADNLKDTIHTTVPLKIGQRNTTERVDHALIQDVRIYSRALSEAEINQLAQGTRAAWLASKPADKRSVADKNELFTWWLSSEDKSYQAAVAAVDKLAREESALRARGTTALVMQERMEKPMARVLFRGDYDKPREPVEPATPSALPPMPPDLPRNRLGFAKWLLRPEHPLTARVTVNRFWQELFGTGIVKTSGDFGITGEPPSHPELLDWLAVEFRESGWDVKRFFKLMVMSAAYRQAAIITPEKREKDPSNVWLSRGPRFRMDAEMIRDYGLAASGLLVRKIGGPSVRPYQPDGVWEAVAMIGSNTRDYKRDSGANLYRRSMYTFWKRAAPPASMEILNAPNRETCAVRRERTNTPLQALVTLNDPQFVEAARFLAQRVLKEAGEKTDQRLDFLANRVLCRPFKPEERKVVDGMLGRLLEHYKAQPAEAKKLIAVGESMADSDLDPSTLAAWTMLTNALLNLDEVLNK